MKIIKEIEENTVYITIGKLRQAVAFVDQYGKLTLIKSYFGAHGKVNHKTDEDL